MNLHFFRRCLPLLTIAVIALLLLALPRFNSLFFAGRRYERCAQMVQGEPANALAFARAWRAEKPRLPMAEHCEALALFAMKDYRHAAEAFAGLARNAAATNAVLARELTAQAIKSYEAAGEPELAKALAVDNTKK